MVVRFVQLHLEIAFQMDPNHAHQIDSLAFEQGKPTPIAHGTIQEWGPIEEQWPGGQRELIGKRLNQISFT